MLWCALYHANLLLSGIQIFFVCTFPVGIIACQVSALSPWGRECCCACVVKVLFDLSSCLPTWPLGTHCVLPCRGGKDSRRGAAAADGGQLRSAARDSDPAASQADTGPVWLHSHASAERHNQTSNLDSRSHHGHSRENSRRYTPPLYSNLPERPPESS